MVSWRLGRKCGGSILSDLLGKREYGGRPRLLSTPKFDSITHNQPHLNLILLRKIKHQHFSTWSTLPTKVLTITSNKTHASIDNTHCFLSISKILRDLTLEIVIDVVAFLLTFNSGLHYWLPLLQPNDIDLLTWKRKCAILKSSLTIAGGTGSG